MTDQLDGRDLDRACAEAMGWTVTDNPYWDGKTDIYYCGTEGPYYPNGLVFEKGDRCWHDWALSRDRSTQETKLAWLHSEGAVCVILGHYADHVTACATSPVAENQHAQGTTIDQALARLIVAVAKAKKEQGQ